MKRRRTKRDWPALMAEFETSGMSGAAFCKIKGITSSNFYAKRKRWRANTAAVAPPSLVDARYAQSHVEGLDGVVVQPATSTEVRSLVIRCVAENELLRKIVVNQLLDIERLKGR